MQTAVALSGRLDARTAADLRQVLHAAVDGGSGDVVVDLAGASLGDATGLGLLVGAHRRAQRAGRRVVLVGVPEPMERLIRATRLHHVLVRAPERAA